MTQDLLLNAPEPAQVSPAMPMPPTTPKSAAGTAIVSRPDLLIASDRPGVDLEAAQRAAADFLAALGVELDRDGLRETPARMARAYAELFDARPQIQERLTKQVAGCLAEFFAVAGVQP